MLKRFFIIVLLLTSVCMLGSWGFWGHKTINHTAIFTLPNEMIGFYKHNIEHLTEHAVDADKRRYIKADEAAKHFIDLDHYGPEPVQNIPLSWYKAVEKYSEDSLEKYGILPWNIQLVLAELTAAFREKNSEKILYLSANLGHYIADAHVPLHTTQNYNGQLSGQLGIHGFWESRIPELFGDSYTFWVGKACYYAKPQEEAWRIVRESFALLDSVLILEKQLSARFSDDQKYAFEQRGNKTIKTYSAAYSSEYDMMLNNMAERRMQAAVLAVGSFLYTAWVNAGKPNLNQLIEKKAPLREPDEAPGDSIRVQRPHED